MHIKPINTAFNVVDLKSLSDGTKQTLKLRTSENVEVVELESPARYTILFVAGGKATLMHTATFEQARGPGEGGRGAGAAPSIARYARCGRAACRLR